MLNNFLDWLDHRTGHRGLVHDALFERIPSGARFRYVTGSMLVFAFVTQAITGLFLWMAYSPSSTTAYESVYYIQHEMIGGWLLRGIHHFMAQAMVVTMGLHLFQVVWDGAYRPPREFNYWIGLILMMLVMGLGLTGYLLPWDQKGFWATNVATNLMTLSPGVGKEMQQLAVGGNAYGHHTLTRFFAMHAGVLPLLLVGFLALHIALFRRHGLTAKITPGRADDYFWPVQVMYDSLACLVLLTIVMLLVVHFDLPGVFRGELAEAHRGADLGAPADGSEPYAAARPEWYYLFLFELLKFFPGNSEIIGAIVIPTVVVVLLFLLPLVGWWNFGHQLSRAFIVLLILAAATLTVMAFAEDGFVTIAKRMNWTAESHPKWLFTTTRVKENGERETVDTFEKRLTASREFVEAKEAAERDAERAVELINRREMRSDGTLSDVGLIPKEGAVSLLRNDPLARGPRLFNQHCASCHGSEAPKLVGFATRSWIKGLLSGDQIAGEAYFGKTAHKTGRMATWVKQNAASLKADGVEAIAAALSAQAQLHAQREADKKDAELIQRGVGLVEQTCTRGCHKFGDRGRLGLAPDLTGYGSYEWLMGFVSDPTNERFYRHENDRMPSFAKDLVHPENNSLSIREISLIVDWLRSDYYRPEDEQPVLPHGEETAKETVAMARTTGNPWTLIVGAAKEKPESELQRARRLFAANCSVCHGSLARSASEDDEAATSAPSLAGFGSREWLTRLLDPKEIKSARYFGNTRHVKGEMAGFVVDNLKELDDADKDRLKTVIAALSAEAALPSQADADKAAEADGTLAKGRKALGEAFESSSCTDCHKFRDQGDLGSAPDLTGWASTDWLVRFITDPTHERFYRETNDRMPSFGKSSGGPTKQALLSAAEIELIARLIRGELK
jgi:ubiquinol-cytochrome c reductase cytochrome b subunit